LLKVVVNALYSPLISKGIIVIVGGYGSGKSEVAVNLARHLAKSQPEPVAIADLDIVNPYFRSREAMKVLDAMNVKSIVPPGAQFYADLPIILPQIKGAIEKNEGKLLLDAGGDDVGARVLSSLSDAFVEGTYDMFLVLNANRPFTSTMDGCVKMINAIERAARLKFTGLISNTHMMDDSTVDGALRGLQLTQEVGERTKLPVVFLSAEAAVAEGVAQQQPKLPILPLKRMLLKPWEIGDGAETDNN